MFCFAILNSTAHCDLITKCDIVPHPARWYNFIPLHDHCSDFQIAVSTAERQLMETKSAKAVHWVDASKTQVRLGRDSPVCVEVRQFQAVSYASEMFAFAQLRCPLLQVGRCKLASSRARCNRELIISVPSIK